MQHFLKHTCSGKIYLCFEFLVCFYISFTYLYFLSDVLFVLINPSLWNGDWQMLTKLRNNTDFQFNSETSVWRSYNPTPLLRCWWCLCCWFVIQKLRRWTLMKPFAVLMMVTILHDITALITNRHLSHAIGYCVQVAYNVTCNIHYVPEKIIHL